MQTVGKAVQSVQTVKERIVNLNEPLIIIVESRVCTVFTNGLYVGLYTVYAVCTVFIKGLYNLLNENSHFPCIQH